MLEGTGVYHEQAALTLHESDVRVSVVNPAQTRDFARALAVRTKTDAVDSQVLARYAAMGQPRLWTPPPRYARKLQALLARRDAVAQDLQRERNRLEKNQAPNYESSCILVSQSLADAMTFLNAQLDELQREVDGIY